MRPLKGRRGYRIPKAGVHDLRGVAWSEAVDALSRGGWRVYIIEGGPRSRLGFMDALIAAVPTNPRLGHNEGWDAMSDSVYWGLAQSQDERIAIVWPESRLLALEDRVAYARVRDVFKTLAAELAKSRPEVDYPTDLLLLVG